jgi:hypothetical protein
MAKPLAQLCPACACITLESFYAGIKFDVINKECGLCELVGTILAENEAAPPAILRLNKEDVDDFNLSAQWIVSTLALGLMKVLWPSCQASWVRKRNEPPFAILELQGRSGGARKDCGFLKAVPTDGELSDHPPNVSGDLTI